MISRARIALAPREIQKQIEFASRDLDIIIKNLMEQEDLVNLLCKARKQSPSIVRGLLGANPVVVQGETFSTTPSLTVCFISFSDLEPLFGFLDSNGFRVKNFEDGDFSFCRTYHMIHDNEQRFSIKAWPDVEAGSKCRHVAVGYHSHFSASGGYEKKRIVCDELDEEAVKQSLKPFDT